MKEKERNVRDSAVVGICGNVYNWSQKAFYSIMSVLPLRRHKYYGKKSKRNHPHTRRTCIS